jgi:uncharacterized lipoprotein YmbA
VTMRTLSSACRGARSGVWAIALGVAATLAGCASAPPERTWLSLPLETSSASPTTVASAPNGITAPVPRGTPQLRLLRVQIPEYLQSNRVRFRDSATTLAEWSGVRWAERIEMGLTRHLGAQLNGVAGTGAVCEDTCNAQALSSRLTDTGCGVRSSCAKKLHAQLFQQPAVFIGCGHRPRLFCSARRRM